MPTQRAPSSNRQAARSRGALSHFEFSPSDRGHAAPASERERPHTPPGLSSPKGASRHQRPLDHWNSVNPTEEEISLPMDLTLDIEIRKTADDDDSRGGGAGELPLSETFQRAVAAAWAISDRSMAVRALARALPPLRAYSLLLWPGLFPLFPPSRSWRP